MPSMPSTSGLTRKTRSPIDHSIKIILKRGRHLDEGDHVSYSIYQVIRRLSELHAEGNL